MKQKVKTFFYILKNSFIPNSFYYKKITKTHFSFSLKYFFVLILILNFFLTIFIVFKFNPKQTKIFCEKVINQLKNYPSSTIIKINNGLLTSTLDRPYFFWGGYKNKRLWLVVDESANPKSIIKYNSYGLLTKKELVIKPNFIGKNYQIISLAKINSLTISKETVNKIVDIFYFIKKNLTLIYFISLPLLFIFVYLSFVVISFFYLILISLLIYLIFHYFFHRKIHLKKIFQIGLHAITTPLLLDYFLFIYQPKISISLPFRLFIPFPVAFLTLLLVFVFVAVYEAYHNH